MLRVHRATAFVTVLFLFAFVGGCRTAPAPVLLAPADDPQQIHWQRSLDDALALSRSQGVPLLIAVSMDGESASDRIVREQYRDPAFVAMSRHYVCVVASLFRHNPRDYDDQGRRIPCPRLGSCTCGEHIALEPLTYDRFLSDGERVAPRHAVIAPDGSKVLDESLSFDLKDIDRALIAAAGDRVLQPDGVVADWNVLAAARTASGRAAFEAAIVTTDVDGRRAALRAIAAHGDAGSFGALRALMPRHLEEPLADEFCAAVIARGLVAEVAATLRDLLGGLAASSRAVYLWPLLERLEPDSEATRVLAMARRGAFVIDEVLTAATSTRIAAAGQALPLRDSSVKQTAEALTRELEQLDRASAAQPNDAVVRARYAKASLDLARLHIETGERDVAILLADAELNFRRALDLDASHPEWWIERARTAYYESRFADEIAHGRTALRVAIDRELEQLDARVPLQDGLAVEALRWIADGAARSYGEALQQDPATAASHVQAALRAFGAVAASHFGDDRDWGSFASFCGSLGLWREQLLAGRAGALRHPGSPEPRQWLNDALWRAGPVDEVVGIADSIVAQLQQELGAEHPSLADAQWWAGQAGILDAENLRRMENCGEARARYADARQRFDAAATRRPDYADNCRYCSALTHFGAGLAAVRDGVGGDRAGGADELLVAVRLWANLTEARDGLGYDVLDLVDKICEWRAPGPSPVDVERLVAQLDEVAPDTAFWAVAFADSQLREALRADGRNTERAMRDTVDAGGNPIRMLMGLPNAEGDEYLQRSMRILRGAKDRLVSDDDKKVLAQSDTIWAERQLERDRLDGVVEALQEAAELLGQSPPAADADVAALRASAAQLRALLGEARPRWRIGR